MKLPYGNSNFKSIRTEKCYYIDRTTYIEKLERFHSKNLIFLRPRRFGKSLFLSMLRYYYGIEFKDQFEALFENTYIGINPTEGRGSYHMLRFDFSGIETSTEEKTVSGFLANVRMSVGNYIDEYLQLSEAQSREILAPDSPANVMKNLFRAAKRHKMYLLIDEYDHFANEILAFDFDRFTQHIGENGFVRKFYETLKQASGDGIIDRIFITGVTPITMDGLTSGFNIGIDLTTEAEFNGMLGFTKEETVKVIEDVIKLKAGNLPEKPSIMNDVANWYNGYRFSKDQVETIYNPDMVLYFCLAILLRGKYPDKMIDNNIAGDYGKIRRLFKIQDEQKNHAVLEELINHGCITTTLTGQFSFERDFNQGDFISLLFYLGFLSIDSEELTQVRLSIPNHVIRQLYWDYFIYLLKDKNQLNFQTEEVHRKIHLMAQENRLDKFVGLLENTLATLFNRDYIQFDEKYIKVLFVAFANLTNLYFVKSEPEIEKGYPDLMLLFREPFRPNYQFIFELKYLKKKESKQLKQTALDAENQLRQYLQTEELKSKKDLKAWVIVFVGDKAEVLREICFTEN